MPESGTPGGQWGKGGLKRKKRKKVSGDTGADPRAGNEQRSKHLPPQLQENKEETQIGGGVLKGTPILVPKSTKTSIQSIQSRFQVTPDRGLSALVTQGEKGLAYSHTTPRGTVQTSESPWWPPTSVLNLFFLCMEWECIKSQNLGWRSLRSA